MLYHFRHLSLQDGWSPVHVAARNGHLHIVRELVEKLNADVLATKPVCLWFTLHVKVPIKLCTKLLPLFVCTGLAECPASSCVWRSFWGSEVPSAHLRTLQVWLWQPSSDLPTQGSQRRALEDPEVPHWRTRIWSKPYRPSMHSIQRFVALVICTTVCFVPIIKTCNSDAAMLPHCVHNVSSLLHAIGVIGLEYPTHCCTHSPNVCRMTWTASCWLVPMGGWGLCRSWWQGTTWTSTRRTRYFCMYNRMCWHLSYNIQLQLNLLWSYNIELYGITCGSVYILSSCQIVLSMHSLVRRSTLHWCTLQPLQGGWTGVLAAAKYGHAEVLRELVAKYGCDKNATKRVIQHVLCCGGINPSTFWAAIDKKPVCSLHRSTFRAMCGII